MKRPAFDYRSSVESAVTSGSSGKDALLMSTWGPSSMFLIAIVTTVIWPLLFAMWMFALPLTILGMWLFCFVRAGTAWFEESRSRRLGLWAVGIATAWVLLVFVILAQIHF